MTPAERRQGTRGLDLLLVHCLALDARPRPCARRRLEAALGCELARRLLGALAGDQRPPARVRRG